MDALNAAPDGGAPKNPYDLFNYSFMTSKAGQLNVVGVRETVPDSDFKMSVDGYTVTFPCNTASMADMKENYYFLFVPYYLLTRTSYSFFVNRKDNHSALDYEYTQMPHFPLGDVVARCIVVASYGETFTSPDLVKFRDIHGFNIACGALRLFDLLDYGCFLDVLQEYKDIKEKETESGYTGISSSDFINAIKENLNNDHPNALRLAAYQKCWYCYFRNSIYDNEISPRCFNFDDVTYPSDTTYNILDYRDLDDFIIECCQLRYVQNKKDIVSGLMPGTQYGAVSSVPLSADLIGTITTDRDITYPDRYLDPDSGTQAYGQNGSHDSFAYKGYMGRGDISGDKADALYLDWNGSSQVFDAIQLRQLHTHTGSVELGGSGQSLFDVLQLTEAQAIQKWRQKSMLAGQRARNQYKAHFGAVPRHMADDYPEFIGSTDNVIHISQVVSQANTMADEDKSNLGDLSGRGYAASDNKEFRFHCNEQGVVLLLRSIVAENVYTSYGLARANQLIYYTDFYQSELQNIGLEAVPKKLLTSFNPSSDYDDTLVDGVGGDSLQLPASPVLGYAPRNYQLKQYVSKAHGLFNPSRFTGVPISPSQWKPYGFGELEAFVQLRRDVMERIYQTPSGELQFVQFALTLGALYCSPSITDSTFAFDADSFEDTDTFIHKIRFNFDAIQPLSVLGLPQF